MTGLAHGPAMICPVIEIASVKLPPGSSLTIASLGPAGTSSEDACRFLRDYLRTHGHARVSIRLYDSYEDASESLAAGVTTLLVAANAYAGIAPFYMNPGLGLVAVFVKDTPQYGLAGVPHMQPGAAVRVATHPAPEPLVNQLLPRDYRVTSVVMVDSTSAAAAAARAGAVDLALTTAHAARLHGLRFVSATRPIRMVWSAFARTGILTPAGPRTMWTWHDRP